MTIDTLENFNPNGVGAANGNIFGLPHTYENAQIVIIPVPWEVTVSYLAGTARGAQAVLDYSPQIDLFDFDVANAWKIGIYMLPVPKKWLKQNDKLRKQAAAYIRHLEEKSDSDLPAPLKKTLQHINQTCEELKMWVREQAAAIVADGKIPCVLGGDHSTPLGLMEAITDKHKNFGILQVDAHADLRDAYEGFTYSHASIMFNALKLKQVKKLVSVGVRDICEAEVLLAEHSKKRVVPFYDFVLRRERLRGEKNWQQQCNDIVKELPDEVYVSFDIDGLSPEHCPNTGTPVAGGLSLEEAVMLLNEIVAQNKKIIACDLCEVSVGNHKKVAPEQEFNANVGARVLYKMCNLMAKSQGKA
ncbi:MAG: agmatinase family protein [Sphingobacteriales bacterium]|nr:agmatinase family protein [Sphingobacteriales bacterium]